MAYQVNINKKTLNDWDVICDTNKAGNTVDYLASTYSLALDDELVDDTKGHTHHCYRLYAKEPHSMEDAFRYVILCPHCHQSLKQIRRPMDAYKLGLYVCPCCDKLTERN